MGFPFSKLLRAALWIVVLFPAYAAYGAFVVVRGVARGVRAGRGARLARATTIDCPNGHANPTLGRWECASCHASYHGWVGRCGICGAGASWFACSTCGVGIRLPWEP